MSALFYSLIIMLTLLALNLALVVLGFEMATFLIIMLTLLALCLALVVLGFRMVKSSRTLGLQPLGYATITVMVGVTLAGLLAFPFGWAVNVTLLAFIVVLLALGLILAKIGPRRVSFRRLGYGVIGIRVALTALLVFAFRDSWVAFTRD